MPPALVTAVAAVRRDVPTYLDEIGRCVASEVVNVTPQVSGKITTIAFEDGADLAPNAHLFTIDPRPYRARLDEAEARVTAANANVAESKAARETAAARVASAKSRRDAAAAQTAAGKAMADAARGDTATAEADAARAREDLQRMQSMAGSGAISAQDLSRSRTEASAAEGRLASAKRREVAAVAQAEEAAAAERSATEAIAEAESQLAEAGARIQTAEAEAAQAAAAVEPARLDHEFCTIRSPIQGRAGRRLADAGNVVTAGVTPLLSIQRLDPAHVEFSVTEGDLLAVQAAMAKGPLAAEVRIPDDEAPGAAPRKGEVVFLDNAVTPGTGTVRLRAKVDNADGRYWPGRFVRVRLLLGTVPGAILVPATAPQVSAHGPFVYVAQSGKDPQSGVESLVAAMRPVRVGQTHGDLVVVEGLKEPLAAGDRVIVERQMFLFPGAKVVVAEPPAAGAGASGGAPAAPPPDGSR
jgi:multidrug efflux system membrane fusion protein